MPNANMESSLADATAEWLWRAQSDPSTVEEQQQQQRSWDQPIVSRKLEVLMEIADAKTQARLFALSTPESGAWLRALPVATVANLLNDDTLRISGAP